MSTVMTVETPMRQVDGAAEIDCQPLVLNVRVSPTNEFRAVRVTASKCTIGSATSCNLRLIGPGIHPVHCSILRGPRGAWLRRWAGEVSVNGAPVEESPVRTGDQIALGTVDLEIVADGVSTPLPPKRPSLGARELRRLYRGRIRRFIAQSRSYRERETQLQGQAHDAENTVQGLEQHIAELQAALDDRLAQLAGDQQQREDLEHRHREFSNTIEQLRMEVQAAAALLEERERDHLAQRDTRESEFAAQRSTWETEMASQRTSLEGELASLRTSFEAELASQRTSFEGELASQRTSFEGELALQRSSLEDELASKRTVLEDELASQRTSFEGELASQRSSLEDELASKRTILEDEFASKRTVLEDEFASKRTVLEDEFASKRTALEDEFASKRTALEDELTSQRSSFEVELASKQTSWETELASQRTSWETELASQRTSWETELASQRTSWETELASQRTSWATELAAVQEEAQRSQAECQQISSALSATRQEYDALRAREADLQREIEQAYHQERDTRRQLDAALNEAQDVRRQLEDQRQQLQERCKAADRQFESLRQENETVRSELREATRLQGEYEQQWSNTRIECEQLRELQAEATVSPISQEMLTELEARAIEATSRAEELEQRLARVQASQQAVEAREKESETRCQTFRQTLSIAEQTITMLRTQSESNRAGQERQRLELEHMRQESEQLRGKITELEREIACRLETEPDAAQATEIAAADAAEASPVKDFRDPVAGESNRDLSPNSPTDGEAPAETSEILARLKAAGVWKQDSHDAESCPSPSDEPTGIQGISEPESVIEEPVVHSTASTASQSQSSSDVIPRRSPDAGEESIEDYMARLMERVRGESSGKSGADTIVAKAKTPQVIVTSPLRETQLSSPVAQPVQSAPEQSGISYSQRSIPAEYKSNLAAMRQIANNSARTAIATHDRRGWLQSATGKFIASGIACLASVGISYLSRGANWQVAGAGCGFGIAAYWAVQGVLLTRTARGLGPKDPAQAEASNPGGDELPKISFDTDESSPCDTPPTTD